MDLAAWGLTAQNTTSEGVMKLAEDHNLTPIGMKLKRKVEKMLHWIELHRPKNVNRTFALGAVAVNPISLRFGLYVGDFLFHLDKTTLRVYRYSTESQVFGV